jgi:hypothetical protein
VSHPEIVVYCIPHRKKLLPLNPTTEENLLRCTPQHKKYVCIFPTTAKNLNLKYIHENKFFSKMVLTNESGARRISLMKKMEVKNLVVLSL